MLFQWTTYIVPWSTIFFFSLTYFCCISYRTVGSFSSWSYLWFYLEECWGSAFLTQVCCVSASWSIYLRAFWEATGKMLLTFSLSTTSYLLWLVWKDAVLEQEYVDAVNDHKIQNGHANHAWLCLDLLEVLCQLAERGYASSVRSILEHPLKHCPEVLLLGMAHINVPSMDTDYGSFLFLSLSSLLIKMPLNIL